MDYLNPKKEYRHQIIMLVGYACLAIAITIATLVLLYQAYGFGINKNGTVIQNSLAFFSSHPSPADIYVDGKRNKTQTNSRLVLPEGIYRITLAREGYRDWQRTIELDGGQVQHFDYPFLFPKQLETKKVQSYSAAANFVTQSPDRRWLLIGHADSDTALDVYDLKSPDKQAETINLPTAVVSKSSTSESWKLAEWADDNRHVLLRHTFDGKLEYLLVDRSSPEQSVNLSTTLSTTPTELTFNDKKYDKYYLYDQVTSSLKTATLDAPAPKDLLEHVLTYQSYADDTVLYATDAGAPSGKVLVKMMVGDTTYPIRTFASGTNYLLDLTKYSDNLYVTAGAASQDKVYIYKDPIGQLKARPKSALIPSQVLHVTNPTYLSFSNSAQFIVAQGGQQFGVYDIENKKGFNYSATQPLDKPAEHATWMDGNRLMYTSSGKLLVFDYDNTNQQTLMNTNAAYLPAFTPDYKYMYTISQTDLQQTALRTTTDL